MLRYAIWLSGEHPTLPYAELRGATEAEGVEIIDSAGRIAVIEGENADKVFPRMGYAKRSSLLITSGTLEDVKRDIERYELPEGTFAVRAYKYGDFHGNRRDVERKIGEIVASKRSIDLENPDNVLSLYLGERVFAGIEVRDTRGLSEREPTKRPYFSPVTLSPKMARALVNLSRARRGRNLLDPFCGTGAVLIEAALIGINPIGSDFDPRMIEGAEENLRFYGVDAELHVMDISDIERFKVRHIATDPPYGRSSRTGKEDIESLYRRMFRAMSRSLEENGYLAIILPDIAYAELADSFSLLEHHTVRVHRSLNRHFCLFRRD